MKSYSLVDHPLLLKYLFHPRKDFHGCPPKAFDSSVQVDKDIYISTRFYVKEKNCPWVLYFHGNGEVVSDYDNIAPFYNNRNINLVVADYRGYGSSSGSPSFENIIKDAHILFKAVREELDKRNFPKDLWIMGRSLGSISALELAYNYTDEIKGLIIESGFISVARLIWHLDIPAPGIDLDRLDQECLDVVKNISLPSLIIHGQFDNLVPAQEAKDLYNNLGTDQKNLLIIPYADHNNIIIIDPDQYFETVQKFIKETS